jgi:hypothetical protein
MELKDEPFNLRKFWARFPIVSQRALGGPRMQELEALFAPLKTGSAEFNLDYIHIVADEDARLWRFHDWWKMPEIREEEISDLKHAFRDLHAFNESLIARLFALLKNIEIVSCILRFVSPENYSIFSTPVEDLLNIKGRAPVAKYISYLRNLEELGKIYQIRRAADVDMALWTLAHILGSPELQKEPQYKELYESYMREPNAVKRIMAGNALEQVWGERQYIHIADLFLKTDFSVAGILAGRELELHVKKLCKARKIPLTFIDPSGRKKNRGLRTLARDLLENGVIDKETQRRVIDWWQVRCDLTHEEAPSVPEAQVRRMISGVVEFLRR